MWGCGLDSSDLGQGPAVGCCEHTNDPVSSMKGKEYRD
jgi:hypothetical protein